MEMQDDVSELLRSAIREYRQTKVSVGPVSTLSHHSSPPDHRRGLSRAIVEFLMTLRLGESDQVRRGGVKCTCFHKDVLTAHQGPVFCPFSRFHRPSSMQRRGIVQLLSLAALKEEQMRAHVENRARHISLHIPTHRNVLSS